jgi:catechol 2,3-dioxygenase-like lactoylglutathione lyase family enzyme
MAANVTSELPPISAIVPMIHVEDIERSITFYRLLGFEVGNYMPREPGARKHWAWLYAPKAPNWKRGPNLMLVVSECAIDAHAQEVLFYLYAPDLPSLRAHLLESGVDASEISYPEYLPNGEIRVVDPDGYTLMIGQAADNTP